MKIAVTATADSPQARMDPRFGRAKWFMMLDTDGETWESVDNVQNLNAAQGAGIQAAAKVVNAGAEVLISGHCGPKAFKALSRAGVTVFLGSGEATVAATVEAYRRNELEKLDDADVEGHW
ncbi:MAG: NifB/NifX family molybdenum-iron cluster-binding protein [Chitinispirillaceae bacterium]|nr:NifB/NifX family molybdenum-iron cluster-binding protein [Chitinispirillaceae bacterium]